jgi:hypothetical protein
MIMNRIQDAGKQAESASRGGPDFVDCVNQDLVMWRDKSNDAVGC